MCLGYMVRTERNNRLFQNKVSNMHQLVDKIKIHSYWGMKAANVGYVLGVHNWLACPFVWALVSFVVSVNCL